MSARPLPSSVHFPCNFGVREASHQAGQETVHPVGKQAALDAGVGIWALDGQAADIARGLKTRQNSLPAKGTVRQGVVHMVQALQAPGLNVTDRLHRRDHEAQQQRDESWRVEADVEGCRPARDGKGLIMEPC